MKYEYKVVEITWNGKHGIIEDTLNEFGAQGWRAAEFRWHSGSHEWVHVLFERMLPTPLMRASPKLSMYPHSEQAGEFHPVADPFLLEGMEQKHVKTMIYGNDAPIPLSRMIADPESGWSDETQYHPVDSSDA